MPRKPRVLFVATVATHIRSFHLPYLEWFQQHGFETHVACGDAEALQSPFIDKIHQISLRRSPFSLANLAAVLQLRHIINKNDFSLVHCHTPMGGVVGRLASLGLKNRPKVVYTAHGFHFYRGAPWLNWLLYYPVEKLLASHTDCLITINRDDFLTAVRHRFPASHIERVAGVGVDLKRFHPLPDVERASVRRLLGYGQDEALIISAAEFNKNKNQSLLLQAFTQMLKAKPSIKARLLLAGEGPLRQSCEELAGQLGIADQVEFLGYRRDLDQLLPLCDLAVSASYREGLPVNVIEALSCGLPVVASDIRGHRDLISPPRNGLLVKHGTNTVAEFSQAMLTMLTKTSHKLNRRCTASAEPYDQKVVVKQVTDIYRRVLTQMI